ncbi:hypothetical protein [Moraxella bovis]|uniref:hypothetical protein n=1 Tax=Moraxella bovis TaxID=476 RepID=UPI0009C50B1E|nr:hypothetical protein [Moraxella bovis]AWY20275.1 hypothetical protein DQF64_07080 [Moraxella bovis]OOR92134.1 hypothetical protein B0182_01455 [Moraxella bovis]UYZ79908.1 hypothetical protein LP113_07515 [Moraxella bovis]UYZ94108.1 hypothetical protein LP121_09455 [Moraxella bovis]
MIVVPLSMVGLSVHASESVRYPFSKPNSSVQFGVVNHGRKTGISADRTTDDTHAIIGVGKSLAHGYVYGTASYANENHHNTDLSAYGASVGGVYLSERANIDANVIVHRGDNKHLGSSTIHQTHTSETTAGNIKTITTTHTTTTTTRTFDGDVRGYANVGATFDVGQHGEIRTGLRHEFGMDSDTHANVRYQHYYDSDRSMAYVYADTDSRYETGIQHSITGMPISVNAHLFHHRQDGKSDNGGGIGLTYHFGGGSSLRGKRGTDSLARMNAHVRQVISTASPHSVKEVDRLGTVVANIKTETSSSEQQEILDTLTAFKQPTIVVENGNTIRVTDHGIIDMDGVENVEYVLTTVGGTQVKSKNGVFSGLIDGEYTITTTAEAKNGNTGEYTPAINPNEAKATIKTAPVTPIMTPDEFNNIISKLPTSLRD